MLVECSVQSIRYRFRSMFRQMSHEMATRFCFMDYDRELAIVAEVVGESERRLVGAGHLICDADHTNAEYAVLVPDEWQQHGVGSLITECCAQVAVNWGLREIYGETDRLNRGMIATFKHAGFDLDFDTDPDVVLAVKKLASTTTVPP
jgi:acetyltransferase